MTLTNSLYLNGTRYDAVADAPTQEWSDYYVLLHDQHTAFWSYRPRSLDAPIGYPETVPFLERRGRLLTERIQMYWFDLCVMRQYGTVVGTAAWRSLTTEQKRKLVQDWSVLTDSKRFATNGSGTDENANYVKYNVLGTALKSGLPKQWEVACGGNIVKAVSHSVLRLGGKDVIQIEVWNGTDPAPNALTFNHQTHPHLVHLATIATPYLSGTVDTRSLTGPWKVDPFPFFDGKGSPYAMYFSSPNYVEVSRVRRLTVQERAAWRSPYVS